MVLSALSFQEILFLLVLACASSSLISENVSCLFILILNLFLLLFKNLCDFALGKSKSAEKLFPTLFDYHTAAYYRNGLYVFVLAPQAGLEPATS